MVIIHGLEKTADDLNLNFGVLAMTKMTEGTQQEVNKIARNYPSSIKNTVEGVRGIVEIDGKKPFDSPLTDLEAMAQMISFCKGDFVESLAKSFIVGHPTYGRGLSPKMWKWVHKLVYDQANPVAPVKVALGSGDELAKLFQVAGEKVKYPKLSFKMPDGRPLRLSRAVMRAKYPNSINVTDGGKYKENIWYGRIVDGEFQLSRNADEDVVKFLSSLAENPSEFAAEYGVKSGCCCFCNKELTTIDSVTVGYGPVCAKNWSLPWGKKATKKSVSV